MEEKYGKKLLIEVLNDVKKNQNSVCVFDLDSTLIDVSKRTQAILKNISENVEFRNKHPKLSKYLVDVQIHPKDFGIRQILIRKGIEYHSIFYKDVYREWSIRFFGNDYLHHDVLYEGVQEYLLSIKKAGAEVFYLTGRNKEFMGEGTALQIQNWKLPLKTTHLIMKPNAYTEDACYKKVELEKLIPLYNKIWFFENEPAVINFVKHFLPEVKNILVNTSHSGRQRISEGVPSILAKYKL